MYVKLVQGRLELFENGHLKKKFFLKNFIEQISKN